MPAKIDSLRKEVFTLAAITIIEMRVLAIFVVALGFIGGHHAALAADKRVALVIGNASYKYTTPLKNPANDAADVAGALASLGFEVIKGRDLDKAGMERIVRRFASALAGARLGLFFYAGHGLQVAGRNYLVPTDAKATAASALDFEMIRLELIQRIMEQATTTNVILLDACRDNPLTRNLARALGTRSSSIGKGLAQVEAGVGTLISYATQPGNVALDGTNRNSPYSAALKKHLPARDQDLTSILIRVRNDVMAATANRQIPWDQHALRARLYLAGRPASAPAPVSKTAKAPRAPLSEAATAWKATQDSTSIGVLTTFAKRYPDSVFAEMAQSRIVELERRKTAPAVTEATRQKVATTTGKPNDEVVIKFVRPKPGFLEIKRPDKNGHFVVNPKDGKSLVHVTRKKPSVKIAPGTYDVRFASAFWRGVEIKSGQTTVLQPAVLEIKNAAREGHLIIDAASGKTIDLLNRNKPIGTLVPSVVNVRFDKAVWRNVKLHAGKTTVLNPGVLTVVGKVEANKSLRIDDAKGQPAAYLRRKRLSVPLPPGRYELKLGDEKIPFTLQEGKSVKLKLEYR